MPIVTYGSSGAPVLLFPTAAADYLENERFFLVKAIEDLLMAGRVRLFSIDSINSHAWMDRDVPIKEKARRQALYSVYIEEEVVPYIRHVTGDGKLNLRRRCGPPSKRQCEQPDAGHYTLVLLRKHHSTFVPVSVH